MFYVYVIENPAGRFYVGQTDDLERRVLEHNFSCAAAACVRIGACGRAGQVSTLAAGE